MKVVQLAWVRWKLSTAEEELVDMQARGDVGSAYLCNLIKHIADLDDQIAYLKSRPAMNDSRYDGTRAALLRLIMPAKPVDDTPLETSENEAREFTGPLPSEPPPSFTLAALLDAIELCIFAGQPFEGRFPNHPKPGQEWWKALQQRIETLWPKLLAAVEAQGSKR